MKDLIDELVGDIQKDLDNIVPQSWFAFDTKNNKEQDQTTTVEEEQ